MENLNIDIENISTINEFIDIDISLINSLKNTYNNKQDLYDFVYSIFDLAGLGVSDCKYGVEAKGLKDKLYPDCPRGVAWYYCPKLYWIIIFLLENDNSLLACYFKGRAFNELLGQPSQYKMGYKNPGFHSLDIKCAENSAYYYELFFNEYSKNTSTIPYFIQTNVIYSDLTHKYLKIGQKQKAIECCKIQYNNLKNDIHTRSRAAVSISLIESNGDIQKELNLLYYYSNTVKDEYIEKQILSLEKRLKWKNDTYRLMKQGKKQVEIMEELGINRTIIRQIIDDLKKENKVEKVNNKYVAI